MTHISTHEIQKLIWEIETSIRRRIDCTDLINKLEAGTGRKYAVCKCGELRNIGAKTPKAGYACPECDWKARTKKAS